MYVINSSVTAYWTGLGLLVPNPNYVCEWSVERLTICDQGQHQETIKLMIQREKGNIYSL
jgi:hypothetical protein